MEGKQARLTVLIDPHHKAVFDAICDSKDLTSSEVVRQLIVDYLTRHGVRLDAGGGGGLSSLA